jgi:hypothetical protein
MMNLNPGDTVKLRKKHPCGSDVWEVLQTGIDIRIKCLGCQRQLLIDRTILEHKIKTVMPRSNASSNGARQP